MWWTRALVVVSGLLGGWLMLVTFYALTFPTCPMADNEGRVAAPGSAYARVMCGGPPGFDSGGPVLWTLPAVLLVTMLLAWFLAPRASSLPRWAWVAAPLLVPSLLLVVLQLGLPQDCGSGRTDEGRCARIGESI